MAQNKTETGKVEVVEFEGVEVKLTPMMAQFVEAKRAHPDCVLFFRMGDFYEVFFDDAKLVHRELGLTLTSRNKGEGDAVEIPMAGVPFRASEDYIVALVEKGYRVALCDQLEDPAKATGIVRRGVTRIVTPGTLVSEKTEALHRPRLLAAIGMTQKRGGTRAGEIGLVSLDLGTGAFSATELFDVESLSSELARIGAFELLLSESARELIAPGIKSVPAARLRTLERDRFDAKALLQQLTDSPTDIGEMVDHAEYLEADRLKRFFDEVRGFGFKNPGAVGAGVAALLSYVVETQRGVASHIERLRLYHVGDFMIIDEATQANLEITETLRGGKKEGSLLDVIDETVTSGGGRLLRTWLSYPLLSRERIEERHEAVQELVEAYPTRTSVRQELGRTHDIERLTSRLASGNCTPRHLVNLKHSLAVIPPLRELLGEVSAPLLEEVKDQLDPCADITQLIDAAIVDEPPATLQEGGIIREGYNAGLDALVKLAHSGREWLLNYEAKQKAETGISSLKVKYSRVFGYFIDITRANLRLVPDSYIRRQTLANSERYYTAELKEYEEEVLTAEERRQAMEEELFHAVRSAVMAQLGRLRHSADQLARLDVLVSLAHLAHERGYCRPTMRDDDTLRIEAGRHPVVERFIQGERFVPNDLEMNGTDARLQIITGPNMAGKSTVIRQAALIVLLAQAGSFVPAERAEIGLVDRIFSRVGASDNLALGQSTFMVEMTEAANILHNATPRSLVILDEIGRGTSTYDGVSIAWAVAEYLHDVSRARVLFATHYHELTELARTLSGVVNYSVAVKEWQHEIIFLRKLVKGAANRSYGIQVARLAGVPQAVIDRAQEILYNLEMNASDEHGQPAFAHHLDESNPAKEAQDTGAQLALFGRRPAPTEDAVAAADSLSPPLDSIQSQTLDELAHKQLDTTTPLQALNLLYKWQRRLKGR